MPNAFRGGVQPEMTFQEAPPSANRGMLYTHYVELKRDKTDTKKKVSMSFKALR